MIMIGQTNGGQTTCGRIVNTVIQVVYARHAVHPVHAVHERRIVIHVSYGLHISKIEIWTLLQINDRGRFVLFFDVQHGEQIMPTLAILSFVALQRAVQSSDRIGSINRRKMIVGRRTVEILEIACRRPVSTQRADRRLHVRLRQQQVFVVNVAVHRVRVRICGRCESRSR